MENSIITWYSLKKHRNRKFRFYMICVSDLGCILASFLGPLGMIFDICSSLIFGCFLDVFFMALGTKMVPKWLPKWTENLKKIETCALQLSLGGLDSTLTPFLVHFGRHFGRFGHLLAAIWDHFWTCLVSFGHLLVII